MTPSERGLGEAGLAVEEDTKAGTMTKSSARAKTLSGRRGIPPGDSGQVAFNPVDQLGDFEGLAQVF